MEIALDQPFVRYKLVVAYRGTHFHGWQYQIASNTWKEPLPEGGVLRTVQGVLAEKLAEVVGHPVNLVGASRTDAGVHAKGQVCHFDTISIQIPREGLRRAVNARLPGDVVIHSLEPVHPTFDAISDAIHKRYQYCIWNRPDRNVFKEDLAFHRWQQLNISNMTEAGQLLVGTHDFASFAKPGHGRESTIRTITGLDVSCHSGMVVIGVSGTGFLWNQVRIIAGTLIEVGLGRFTVSNVREMLEAKNRQAAGHTAPPHGLYLQWIQHRSLPASPSDPVIPAQPVSPDSAEG